MNGETRSKAEFAKFTMDARTKALFKLEKTEELLVSTPDSADGIQAVGHIQTFGIEPKTASATSSKMTSMSIALVRDVGGGKLQLVGFSEVVKEF